MISNTFPSKSVARLVLNQHHLTKETLGQNKDDIVRIVSDVGGLHAQSLESPYLSLWNRMTNFDWEWLDELLKEKMLIAAHLMRVTLHIVPVKEFPMYFQATRDAIRKFFTSRGLPWPPKFTETHQAILDFIDEKGVATTLEIRRFLESRSITQAGIWFCPKTLTNLRNLKQKTTLQKSSVLSTFFPSSTLSQLATKKRWKRLISVPPVRPGLRAHPAPGVILIDGQVFGEYLGWPNFALFFNVKDKKAETIKAILNKFKKMAAWRGLQVFCIKKIDEKELTSKELKPLLSYFYELGYFVREGRFCKELYVDHKKRASDNGSSHGYKQTFLKR